MPRFCSVVNCGSNNARDKISFHKFPSIFDNNGRVVLLAQERREKWINALKRTDLTEKKEKYGYICSKHFYGGKPSKLSDKDDVDWIPNQNMGYTTTNLTSKVKFNRFQRIKNRNEAKVQQQEKVRTAEIDNHLGNDDGSSTQALVEEIQDQNEMSGDLEQDLIYANTQLYQLRDELQKFKLDMDSLKNDSEKCRFYTGLDFEYFNIVFNFVSSSLSTTQSKSLNKVEMVVLTLMKLRLNFLFKDLGYRFNISRQSASRIFFAVLNILYSKLKFLIHWPERECLQKNVPNCFLENFRKKVTVIIDCFEIFTETPLNKNAAAQHFSNYKHHNTIKLLLGISPQGSIIFISEAFTGRCSDKYIVENSNFLDNLIPGDLILADRGFLIHDQVRQYFAEVHIPAFLTGAKQMRPKDVEETRSLANVRIHVERVISQLRQKYNILGNVVPISMLKKIKNKVTTIDKILAVCCALVNICPSVIESNLYSS